MRVGVRFSILACKCKISKLARSDIEAPKLKSKVLSPKFSKKERDMGKIKELSFLCSRLLRAFLSYPWEIFLW